MESERLARQISFIVEIDKLKQVLRRNLLTDSSRRENSAEHSWHLALMAMLLAEHTDAPVDLARVMKMLLIHDIVEIDAGDTFVYDVEAVQDQEWREQQAAARLFALLPPEQTAELQGLWHEFEGRNTTEARFAAALDRLQPLLLNYHTHGGTWRIYNVTLDQVLDRVNPIQAASASLWDYVQLLLDEAVAAGYIPTATASSEPDDH